MRLTAGPTRLLIAQSSTRRTSVPPAPQLRQRTFSYCVAGVSPATRPRTLRGPSHCWHETDGYRVASESPSTVVGCLRSDLLEPLMCAVMSASSQGLRHRSVALIARATARDLAMRNATATHSRNAYIEGAKTRKCPGLSGFHTPTSGACRLWPILTVVRSVGRRIKFSLSRPVVGSYVMSVTAGGWGDHAGCFSRTASIAARVSRHTSVASITVTMVTSRRTSNVSDR